MSSISLVDSSYIKSKELSFILKYKSEWFVTECQLAQISNFHLICSSLNNTINGRKKCYRADG